MNLCFKSVLVLYFILFVCFFLNFPLMSKYESYYLPNQQKLSWYETIKYHFLNIFAKTLSHLVKLMKDSYLTFFHILKRLDSVKHHALQEILWYSIQLKGDLTQNFLDHLSFYFHFSSLTSTFHINFKLFNRLHPLCNNRLIP